MLTPLQGPCSMAPTTTAQGLLSSWVSSAFCCKDCVGLGCICLCRAEHAGPWQAPIAGISGSLALVQIPTRRRSLFPHLSWHRGLRHFPSNEVCIPQVLPGNSNIVKTQLQFHDSSHPLSLHPWVTCTSLKIPRALDPLAGLAGKGRPCGAELLHTLAGPGSPSPCAASLWPSAALRLLQASLCRAQSVVGHLENGHRTLLPENK